MTASEVTVGTMIKVFWEDDDRFYPGVVTEFNEKGKAHLTDEAADKDGENIEVGGNDKKNKRGGAVKNFLAYSLCERWKSELGQSRLTDLAVEMQKKALLDTTLDNYGPKAERFINFCVNNQRPWLPATETPSPTPNLNGLFFTPVPTPIPSTEPWNGYPPSPTHSPPPLSPVSSPEYSPNSTPHPDTSELSEDEEY
ncbi:hypothetical protein CYMTET_31885 [Cymbomonas tetramitiformis]|uniref:Tudor domain-containing protein n=1 Tax=Cymbomonas tetramitiformis TaxID=36881 RepID=A0AAE0FG82_9CHLO|nr:hypothetical protein CYMTET_31885 [Cymbomonas tetramitiformis]